ncbi:MAG: outer membrane protein assembly factor BamA [Deltaproteobacteria bacterium]|nr:outer membrane protein assembly factor BamA [Deltaproteobacteria bacterium]
MRATVVTLLLALVPLVAAPPAAGQADPFGESPGMQGGKPPKEEEYVRPKEALEPLPEPLTADEEKARERAKERGVLLSDKPKAGFISELRVLGVRKVEPDAVLMQIQSRIDKKPDARVIQADIRRLWAMDIFDDVTVETKAGANDSVVLVFRLREKPAVDEVIIEGNREVTKEDIEEVVDIKPYQVLDVAKVRANVGKIQKLYVDKGYFLAEVTYQVRPSTGTAKKSEGGLLDFFKGDQSAVATPHEDERLAGDEPKKPAAPARPEQQGEGEFVDVVFTVAEAAKVRIETMTFVGNAHLGADELSQFLRTHTAHPLGVLNEWGTYKEEQIETDLLIIEQVYQDKGYLNVKVGRPRVQLSADKTRMAIEIPITEGKSYQLRSLTVKGDLIVDALDPGSQTIVFTREDLLGRAKLHAGDVFSRTQVAIDVNAIADRYRDKGYAYVNIGANPIIHEEDDSVELELNVESGPRVTVERVDIVGNAKTQDRVIRRELRLYEGEYYAGSAMRLSEQRVNALGFFEKVTVTSKQGTQPDRMIVVIEVKEKSTGTFQLGAGFSSAESILFTGQISYNNFLGLGTTVSGSVQWSGFRRIFDFRYMDPYAFYLGGEPVTIAFSAFNTSRYFLDFTRDSTGIDATVGYPIGRPLVPLTAPIQADASPWLLPYVPDFENLQLFVAGNLERVVIEDTSFGARLVGLQTHLPRYTTSVRTSIVFDQRNNRLFPSAGWFLSGSVELATPMLGSELAPGAEKWVKESLQGAGVQDGLGFLYKNGRANDFQRYSLTARAYYNFDEVLPIKGVVLKSNIEWGLIHTDDELVFENFYMGGFNTIRGYYLRSISPVARVGSAADPSAPLLDFRTGGNQQFFTNLELEFPLLEQVGIRGVAFFDAGNVYGPGESVFYFGQDTLHPELPLGLFYSVGVGIRWFSPIGPLRFEFGVPLTPRPKGTFGFAQGDQPFSFEFNVGNSF